MSSKYEIKLFTAAGVRKPLPMASVGSAHYTTDLSGGFADASLTLHGSADALVSCSDRVEIYQLGVLRWRGYVAEKRLNESEPPSTEITCYGRIYDLKQIIIRNDLTYPSRVDLSLIASEIFSIVSKRHIDLVIEIDVIGIVVEQLIASNRSAFECLQNLAKFAASRVTWGCDVDPASGADRLFFRLVSPSTQIDRTIALPGLNVGDRESRLSIADLYNSVVLECGTPRYPQLIPNGSMEELWRAADTGGGDLLLNQSFEQAAGSGSSGNHPNHWTLSSNFQWVANFSNVAPLTGTRAIKLDRVGDVISQTRTGVLPIHNHTFVVGAWLHPEQFVHVGSGDDLLLPQVTVSLTWLDNTGAAIGSPVTKIFTVSAAREWRQYDFLATSPADPTINLNGFTVSYTLSGPWTSGSLHSERGVLIDEAYLQDTSLSYPSGWQAVSYGDAVIYNFVSINPSFGAFNGRNAAVLQYKCTDADTRDIHFRYSPTPGKQSSTTWDGGHADYTFAIVGGNTYRFGGHFYIPSGSPDAKIIMEAGFYRADGTFLSNARPRVVVNTRDAWQYLYFDHVAPHDAARCEMWITLRGDNSGSFDECFLAIDALSCRSIEDPDIDTYIQSGNLVISFNAEDICDSSNLEEAEAYASYSTWGRREKLITLSSQTTSITTIADARQLAREFFLVNAVSVPSPTVKVYDCASIVPGTRVKLVGSEGLRFADRPLLVARVQGEIDDTAVLSQNLELSRIVPTDEELYAAMLTNTRAFSNQTSGSGADSGSGRGLSGTGSSGAGVTSVSLAASTGFAVSGSPITGVGTLGLGLDLSLSGVVKANSGGLFSAIAGTDFAAAAHTHSLSDLNVSGASAGQVISWNGTYWAPSTPSTAATFGTQSSNFVFAAPAGGGVPLFRLLSAADIPNLDAAKFTSGTINPGRLGSGSPSSANYLRGDGTWAVVSGGSGGSGAAVAVGNFASSTGAPTITLAMNTYTRVDCSSLPAICGLTYSSSTADLGKTITVTKTDASANAINFYVSGVDYTAYESAVNFSPLTAQWQSATWVFVANSSGNQFWERQAQAVPRMTILATSSNLTLTSANVHLVVTTGTGTVTIILPDSSKFIGQQISIIKKSSVGSVYVSTASGDVLFLGGAAYPLAALGDRNNFVATGTSWDSI